MGREARITASLTSQERANRTLDLSLRSIGPLLSSPEQLQRWLDAFPEADQPILSKKIRPFLPFKVN